MPDPATLLVADDDPGPSTVSKGRLDWLLVTTSLEQIASPRA